MWCLVQHTMWSKPNSLVKLSAIQLVWVWCVFGDLSDEAQSRCLLINHTTNSHCDRKQVCNKKQLLPCFLSLWFCNSLIKLCLHAIYVCVLAQHVSHRAYLSVSVTSWNGMEIYEYFVLNSWQCIKRRDFLFLLECHPKFDSHSLMLHHDMTLSQY